MDIQQAYIQNIYRALTDEAEKRIVAETLLAAEKEKVAGLEARIAEFEVSTEEESSGEPVTE